MINLAIIKQNKLYSDDCLKLFSIEYLEFIEKHHNEKAKEFLEFILERYKKDGIKELDEDKLGKLVDLSWERELIYEEKKKIYGESI